MVEHREVTIERGTTQWQLKDSGDLLAHNFLMEAFTAVRPSDAVLSEEGSDDRRRLTSDRVWIVDPLDGTTNFIKGIPHFAVSIALKVKGRLDQAVIYDPIRGELFTASKGQGAQLNSKRLRVSKTTVLAGTVLATGFPFKHKQHTDA